MKLIITLTFAFLLIISFISADYVGSSSSSCAIYNDICEDGRTDLFRVSSEFFLVGGAHVAKTDFFVFNWVLCCDDIIGGSNPLFSIQTINAYGGLLQHGGSHVFPAGASDYDISIGNNYEIAETCSSGYDCIAKVSSHSTINSHLFINSHIWPCNRLYPGLVSICYEKQNANDLCTPAKVVAEGTCPGDDIGVIGEESTRCVGEEDSSGYGHCCMDGQYWYIDPIISSNSECRDFIECGFETIDQACYLPDSTTFNPGPLYFTSYYFADPDCFIETGPGEFKSCCFDCYVNGYQGNYYQNVEITILS